MTTTTVEDVINAAAAIATDAAEGRLAPDDLERTAAERMRATFAVVAGAGDPLWPDHVAIARQVLGLGGIPAAELAQWTAATRAREANSAAVDPGDAGTNSQAAEATSALEPDEPADVLTAADSSALEPYSGESAAVAADAAAQLVHVLDALAAEPGPEPPAPTPSNRRILARGRGLPFDNGLRPL